MFDLLKNLSADKIFTPTGQPISEAFGIRPDATIAEIAKPDLKFADIAVPFRPGDIDISVRPGRIDPGDVRLPPGDVSGPRISWPSVGIPGDVRPGDLIQAAAWNSLLAWVRALATYAAASTPSQPTAPTPPTSPGTGVRPLPIDPSLIPQLQPIPLPTIPTIPIERPPIESLLAHPDIIKTIVANPSILDKIVTEPKIGEILVANPDILKSIVSPPIAAQPVTLQPILTQPIAAQPVVAQPVAAQPVAEQPVAAQPITAQPIAMPPISGLPLGTIVGAISTQPTVDSATLVAKLSADPIMGRVLESQPVLRTALGMNVAEAVDATKTVEQPAATTTTTRKRVTRTVQPG